MVGWPLRQELTAQYSTHQDVTNDCLAVIRHNAYTTRCVPWRMDNIRSNTKTTEQPATLAFYDNIICKPGEAWVDHQPQQAGK